MGSFRTLLNLTLRKYWTRNGAIWLVDFSYWPTGCLSRVIKSHNHSGHSQKTQTIFTIVNVVVQDQVKSAYQPKWLERAGAYPGFLSMKQLRVFLPPPPPPLDEMLVHRRVTPSSKFTGTLLYSWVTRGTVRVKCLAQEHNAVPCPARARTLTAWSGVQRNNH